MTKMYKQEIREIGLSIEEGTARVPKDGKYYLIKDERILGSYRSLKKAQARYQEIVKETGYKPKRGDAERKSLAEGAIEDDLLKRDIGWWSPRPRRGGPYRH